MNDVPGRSGRDDLVGVGPTLIVNIGFDPNYDPLAPKAPPVLPPDQLWALVDTGAMESCIDTDLAMRLNLPIIDRRQISGVHGAREVNVHLAHIHISSLNFTIYGPFCAVVWRLAGNTTAR